MKYVDPYKFDGNIGMTTYNVEEDTEEIGVSAFRNCINLSTVTFPKSLTTIADTAFSNCFNLNSLTIPDGVDYVGRSAFKKCSTLTDVNLPKNLKTLQDGAFSECYSLSKIDLPESIEFMGTDVFSECQSLKKVVLPKKNIDVKGRCFYKCKQLTTIQNDNFIQNVSAESFAGCESLQSLNLTNSKSIGTSAFTSCINLKTIKFNENVLDKISKHAFYNCKFNYFFKEKNTGVIGFSVDEPKGENIEQVVDIQELKQVFSGFDIGALLKSNMRELVLNLSKKLTNSNFVMPFDFLMDMIKEKNVAELKEMDFRYISNELKEIKNLRRILKLSFETPAFYKFARAIGCFSDKKLVDKNGKETDAIFAQKASTFLYNAMKSEAIRFDDMHRLFRSLSLNVQPNQELLEYLSLKDGKKGFYNLYNLIYLDVTQSDKNVFKRVIENFDDVKKYRKTIDKEGKPKSRSWEKAIQAYFDDNAFLGVDDKTKDLARELKKHGLTQDVFDEAKSARIEAIDAKMVHHILGEELKEKTILESIEEIRNTTSKQINETSKIMEDLYNKQFTYEMLDKYDPKNAIIGLYCDCCATITNMHYGRNIARATMTKNDVQNMVVRDNKGEIIAKTAMYVNKEKGYIVLNDFEINDKYKHNETLMRGIYTDKEDSANEKERELIFSAFKRGLKAFVKKYNELNPDNEIKFITVGTNYNRLKRQCYRYKYATKNLFVPVEYSFQDAEHCQILLYKKTDKKEPNTDYIM